MREHNEYPIHEDASETKASPIEARYLHPLCGQAVKSVAAAARGVIDRVEVDGGVTMVYVASDHATVPVPIDEVRLMKDPVSNAVARLKKTYPDYHWTQSDDDEGRRCVAVVAQDFHITDPTLSTCGRFSVEPSEYGITTAAAKALQKENDLIARRVPSHQGPEL